MQDFIWIYGMHFDGISVNEPVMIKHKYKYKVQIYVYWFVNTHLFLYFLEVCIYGFVNEGYSARIHMNNYELGTIY